MKHSRHVHAVQAVEGDLGIRTLLNRRRGEAGRPRQACRNYEAKPFHSDHFPNYSAGLSRRREKPLIFHPLQDVERLQATIVDATGIQRECRRAITTGHRLK